MKHTAPLLYSLMAGLLAYPMLGYTVATEFRPPDDPAAQPAPAATPMDDARQAQRKLLEQRVAAKWDALIRKDFAAAYSFTSPAYRKLYSAEAFKRNFGDKVAWQRITVVDVNFQNDDAATVGINLFVVYHDAQSGKPLDMKTYVQEPWVRTEGQWWYLMKQ